jgi:anti-sigma B factor antagonist
MLDFRVEDYALDGRTHCIEVAGQIDLYTAPTFKARILDLIDQGKTRVIVDLCSVSFLDSTALAVFVAALKRVRARGGALSIICRDYDVERILEISGLDGLIPIHPSREVALAALSTASDG